MSNVVQMTTPLDHGDDLIIAPFPNLYEESGITCDDETARWLLHQASLRDGARAQGDQFRLAEGEVLCRVRDRLPGVFVNWLKVHWPEQSTTTAYRRIALWERRHDLQALTSGDDDGGFSTWKNAPHPRVLETLAMGGAQPEVVAEVKARLDAGQSVTTSLVADLNRESKAKRKGQTGPRKSQPAEALAVSLIRKGQEELARIREAVALAERAEVVTAEQVMEEQRLRQLPKAKLIEGIDADFHRLKDGNWIRLPHAGRVDVETDSALAPIEHHQPSMVEANNPLPVEAPQVAGDGEIEMPQSEAAEKIGMKLQSLRTKVCDAGKRTGGVFTTRSGWRVRKLRRGWVGVSRVAHA